MYTNTSKLYLYRFVNSLASLSSLYVSHSSSHTSFYFHILVSLLFFLFLVKHSSHASFFSVSANFSQPYLLLCSIFKHKFYLVIAFILLIFKNILVSYSSYYVSVFIFQLVIALMLVFYISVSQSSYYGCDNRTFHYLSGSVNT